MKWGFIDELRRKAVHLLSVLIVIGYAVVSKNFSHKVALLVLAFFLTLMIEFEYVRLELGKKIPLVKYLSAIRRAKERHTLGSEVFFLIGAIIVLAVFDIRIAAAAILMTTFGDMAAALIGQRHGKHWINKRKAWEGVIAEFLVDVLIGFLFIRTMVDGQVWWMNGIIPTGEPIWMVIFAMAFTATLVETVVSKIDDNLLIPLFSGFVGQIVLIILAMIGYIL